MMYFIILPFMSKSIDTWISLNYTHECTFIIDGISGGDKIGFGYKSSEMQLKSLTELAWHYKYDFLILRTPIMANDEMSDFGPV